MATEEISSTRRLSAPRSRGRRTRTSPPRSRSRSSATRVSLACPSCCKAPSWFSSERWCRRSYQPNARRQEGHLGRLLLSVFLSPLPNPLLRLSLTSFLSLPVNFFKPPTTPTEEMLQSADDSEVRELLDELDQRAELDYQIGCGSVSSTHSHLATSADIEPSLLLIRQ